ncbi:MAG: alpha/beta hydrolase [Thermosynechococcaceae cyanobacterium]
MFPSFLPADTARLTEATSINAARQMQRQEIQTGFSADAIATTYLQQGANGVPILLLHGFDSSLLEFRRLIPLLAGQQETWALDLLGFGFTDRPADITFSPAELKRHLYQFWKTLIDRPVILVGASMGGALALDFSLAYPDCVDRLVLLDSAGFATSPVPTKLMRPPIDGWATAFLRNPGVRRRISQQAYCDRNYVTPDAELCASLHLQHPRWQAALIAFAKSGGYNFLAHKIAHISQPTLILWGEQDRIMNRKDAPKFQQAITNSHLIWIPNCGHVPHLEQPQLTADHILVFAHNGQAQAL